jgi:hypothetical protein
MKPGEILLPTGGKQASKDGIIERSRNWLVDMVSIGVLMLTAAGILAISDALQKSGATGKPDPTESNVQNVRHQQRANRPLDALVRNGT